MFIEIYSIGILTVLIRDLLVILGSPKETGEVLNSGKNQVAKVISENKAKWAVVLTFIFFTCIVALFWPITITHSIYNWFKKRKKDVKEPIE